MPRKPVDIKPTDYPILRERGLLHPFPAFRRGRVRAEPANGSRDWSLVGFGATPQGLKSPISALFKVRLGLLFSAQLFHRLLDTTYMIIIQRFPPATTAVSPVSFVPFIFTYPDSPRAINSRSTICKHGRHFPRYFSILSSQNCTALSNQPSATVPSPSPNPWGSPSKTSISAFVPCSCISLILSSIVP